MNQEVYASLRRISLKPKSAEIEFECIWEHPIDIQSILKDLPDDYSTNVLLNHHPELKGLITALLKSVSRNISMRQPPALPIDDDDEKIEFYD